MNKHKSNKIEENSNTVRHLIMGQITTTQNLVAIKEVRHAGQRRSLNRLIFKNHHTWERRSLYMWRGRDALHGWAMFLAYKPLPYTSERIAVYELYFFPTKMQIFESNNKNTINLRGTNGTLMYQFFSKSINLEVTYLTAPLSSPLSTVCCRWSVGRVRGSCRGIHDGPAETCMYWLYAYQGGWGKPRWLPTLPPYRH